VNAEDIAKFHTDPTMAPATPAIDQGMVDGENVGCDADVADGAAERGRGVGESR
jgi:hypothetical protein